MGQGDRLELIELLEQLLLNLVALVDLVPESVELQLGGDDLLLAEVVAAWSHVEVDSSRLLIMNDLRRLELL